MALRMTATDVSEIREGIWALSMAPHQIRHFGVPNKSVGTQSVLIFDTCEYDAQTKQLHFDIGDVTPVNIGTTSQVIGIAGNPTIDSGARQPKTGDDKLDILGPGDREFLRLTKQELSEEMAQTAEKLLAAVRDRSPGDLKRGQSRNFSETPDNFWYVIVQPRINELSITVRGSVAHFKPIAQLEIKDDRGNTRFKVQGEGDVEPALKIIFHALRKR